MFDCAALIRLSIKIRKWKRLCPKVSTCSLLCLILNFKET